MTGLLELSEHVLCKKEVLGKTFEGNIAGIKVQIWFPQYPPAEEADPTFGFSHLSPPIIGASWKKGKEPIDWGFPMLQPAGNSCVERLAVSVDCEKDKAPELAHKLYEAISIWEHAFVDHLVLETKQGVERNKNIQRKTCNLWLMEDEYIPENKAIQLFLSVPDRNTFASEESVLNALSFADSGKELLLEYQMLLSAYDAIRQKQNRRAILDACSAMEITLLNQIKLYCQSIGLPPEILTKKYRQLGDRIDLLKQINASVPEDDYKTLVIGPRNAVMHNNDVFPSDETTDKLISCVERFLQQYHNRYY